MKNRNQSRARRMTLAAIALAGGVALGAGPAVAASASMSPWYTTSLSSAQVASSHNALAAGDGTCEAITSAIKGFWGEIANLTCGQGINQARDAIDTAYARGCGIDLAWRDGPLSYDGEYRYTPCP